MKQDHINIINNLGKTKEPFFVLIDFEKKIPLVIPIKSLKKQDDLFISFYNKNILQNKHIKPKIYNIQLQILDKNIKNISKKYYSKIVNNDYFTAFNNIKNNIKYGNSYLTNLTYRTPINLNMSLKDLFSYCTAKYKVYFHKNIMKYNLITLNEDDLKDFDWNEFLCFSPETFIKIINNQIFTYPMKGTINASIENSQQILQDSKKESLEHNTVVDLLRNDLSIVATNTRINKLKYIEKIYTNKGAIFAMSSEIMADLENNWHENIGTILNKLLPAGSVSGAPKQKTLQIISESEDKPRHYYCGIAGYFDGESFDSTVLIRFIHNNNENKMYFHSGGGINNLSNIHEEFNEVVEKIYLPLLI